MKPVLAESPPLPSALRCEFESHTSGTSQSKDSRISAMVKQEPGIDPLIYGSLDPVKGSAQLIGNVGASDVMFVATAFNWSFVEITDAGNVKVTQVFVWEETAADLGYYRAVHSRHSSMMGAIVVSQHYGRCKALS
jgi:hypothetical protein